MCVSQVVFADEWIRTAAAAISPVLVVLGWWWVNRQNNCRERRKEARQLVDRALRTVSDSFDLFTNYHSGKDDNPDVRRLVGWKALLALKQVAVDIELLTRIGFNTRECGQSYVLLKQVATGGDFMTVTGAPWDIVKDNRWASLLDATSRLRHALDLLFFDRFEI